MCTKISKLYKSPQSSCCHLYFLIIFFFVYFLSLDVQSSDYIVPNIFIVFINFFNILIIHDHLPTLPPIANLPYPANTANSKHADNEDEDDHNDDTAIVRYVLLDLARAERKSLFVLSHLLCIPCCIFTCLPFRNILFQFHPRKTQIILLDILLFQNLPIFCCLHILYNILQTAKQVHHLS